MRRLPAEGGHPVPSRAASLLGQGSWPLLPSPGSRPWLPAPGSLPLTPCPSLGLPTGALTPAAQNINRPYTPGTACLRGRLWADLSIPLARRSFLEADNASKGTWGRARHSSPIVQLAALTARTFPRTPRRGNTRVSEVSFLFPPKVPTGTGRFIPQSLRPEGAHRPRVGY